MLVDVDHSMKVMRDETFGPVVGVMKVRDAEEALQLRQRQPLRPLRLGLRREGAGRARGAAGRVRRGQRQRRARQLRSPWMCRWAAGSSRGSATATARPGIKKYCRTESVVITRFGGKREPAWYPYTKARARHGPPHRPRLQRPRPEAAPGPARLRPPLQGNSASPVASLDHGRARLHSRHPRARRRLRRRHGRDPGAVRADPGGLRRPGGQVPRGAGAQPARRDRGRARLDARGRRRGGRDRQLPGLAAEARRVGPGRAHAGDQRQGGRDRPQGRGAGPLRRRLDRPDRLPARLRPTPPWATSPSAAWSRSSPSRRGAWSKAAPT